MGKNKLKRFADVATYPNVVSPCFEEVFRSDFRLKGCWAESIYGNNNPLVLELGCGKGEYTISLAERYPEKNFLE